MSTIRYTVIHIRFGVYYFDSMGNKGGGGGRGYLKCILIVMLEVLTKKTKTSNILMYMVVHVGVET